MHAALYTALGPTIAQNGPRPGDVAAASETLSRSEQAVDLIRCYRHLRTDRSTLKARGGGNTGRPTCTQIIQQADPRVKLGTTNLTRRANKQRPQAAGRNVALMRLDAVLGNRTFARKPKTTHLAQKIVTLNNRRLN